jgi:alkanesulfonate monooxygenase SsuD/methylene tetrahydromethanopterin reductase-like flavin-dependent oxidoreductase (luciferase family)
MIRFLNPTGGWINLKEKVPIYVAASGPKTLELAGEIGDGVILFGAVGDSLLEYVLSHIRRGAERAGKRMQDLYICVLTAFHVAKPGEKFADMQRAVGAYVTSECNIFALSVKGPNELPADIRDDLMKFRDAYRTPDAPIETRHLDLYSDYVHDLDRITRRWSTRNPQTNNPDRNSRGTCEAGQSYARMGVKQIAVHGGTRAGAPKVIADFAKYVIGKG